MEGGSDDRKPVSLPRSEEQHFASRVSTTSPNSDSGIVIIPETLSINTTRKIAYKLMSLNILLEAVKFYDLNISKGNAHLANSKILDSKSMIANFQHLLWRESPGTPSYAITNATLNCAIFIAKAVFLNFHFVFVLYRGAHKYLRMKKSNFYVRPQIAT